jgi:hypothetical protein
MYSERFVKWKVDIFCPPPLKTDVKGVLSESIDFIYGRSDLRVLLSVTDKAGCNVIAFIIIAIGVKVIVIKKSL